MLKQVQVCDGIVQALSWLWMRLLTYSVHCEVQRAIKITTDNQMILVVICQLIFQESKETNSKLN